MIKSAAGPARDRIDAEEMRALQGTGTLVIDEQRRRPLYFDGRFLAARDLTRDQNYFLTRQSDLNRASGSGVVDGLMVSFGDTESSVRISAGHGVTPAGELVVLPEALSVDLGNLAEIQRLDAAFGLLAIPKTPARGRSGLFVLALRPVEFSANPIASYPTSITGERAVEDGYIVEATAVSLIPYSDAVGPGELDRQRAQAARDIFVAGGRERSSANVLPLAMIALNLGDVEWIDPFLVRREIGADRGEVLGLGFTPLAGREAFLLQYEQHLGEVLERRDSSGAGRRFPASEHFLTLPPAGRLPVQAIDPADFTQYYFPAEMDVGLSLIPEDELAGLVAESLRLPPIDLTLEADQFESTSVLIVIPVPRGDVRALSTRLTTLARPLRSTVPGLLAKRRPIQALQELRLRRLPGPAITAPTVGDAAWREVLATADMLWFMRLRNTPYKAEVVAEPIILTSDEVASEAHVTARIEEAGLTTRFNALTKNATAVANARVMSVLDSGPFMTGSRTLIHAMVNELESEERLDQAKVNAAEARFSDSLLGEGMARLEGANPVLAENAQVVRNLARSGVIPELDRLGRLVSDAELPSLAKELEELARPREADQPAKIADFVRKRLELATG